MPKEFDDLIQEYLTDGIISTKERHVLLKKAESLGIDVDEADLYIDAQQQKIDMQINAQAKQRRGKVCPFCGGAVPQLADKCPHCDENITVEAGEELQTIIDQLEDALEAMKSGKNVKENRAKVDRYVRKGKLYYENNPKVKKLLAAIEEETVLAEKQLKKDKVNQFVAKYWKIGLAISAYILLMLICLLVGMFDK